MRKRTGTVLRAILAALHPGVDASRELRPAMRLVRHVELAHPLRRGTRERGGRGMCEQKLTTTIVVRLDQLLDTGCSATSAIVTLKKSNGTIGLALGVPES